METNLYLPSQNGSSQSHALTIVPKTEPSTKTSPFIEANTIESSLEEIRDQHIIPVFGKDMETLISHSDFIELTQEIVHSKFRAERICSPLVRVSHPVRGRIPEARNKPVNQLEEWEKTIFYERMAFLIEVPSISDKIGGEELCLTIGGIKCYSDDNLSSKKGVDEHFRMFIGFKVKVCTNMCIWSDGLVESIGVKSLAELRFVLHHLIDNYDAITGLKLFSSFTNYHLTEQQFANLIGRCKMYSHLPLNLKKEIPQLLFGESQINMVCRDFFKDASFCKDGNGNINLWKLYNLFTTANKTSYIDSYLTRAANASLLVGELAYDLAHSKANWFLS